jgi:hypothetical protein
MGKKYNWELVGRVAPGEHRVFRDADSGNFAIADDSGGTPEQCEDGVLWLDKTRALEVATQLYDGRVHVGVPLWQRSPTSAQRTPTWTGTTLDGALWIVEHCRMRLVVKGELARLVRKSTTDDLVTVQEEP